MNKQDEEVLQSLIAGGFIGAALGKWLFNNAKGGAIAGAAILATYKANEEAREAGFPTYVEENGNLYEVSPTGEKKFMKKLNKEAGKMPANFDLK